MTAKTSTEGKTSPFDLTISRIIAAPRELVWTAWTDPEHIKKWWAPKPWETPECEIDVRPGGIFRTLMRGPDGTEHDSAGVFLEIVPQEKIVFTDALQPGWRPSEPSEIGCGLPGFFTAIITMSDHSNGTEYTARALHSNEAVSRAHEAMGFFEGWGTCIDQLAEVAVALKRA